MNPRYYRALYEGRGQKYRDYTASNYAKQNFATAYAIGHSSVSFAKAV
jgi:hypothetical protein